MCQVWLAKYFITAKILEHLEDCVWNVMVHAQKPDFVFRRNGRVHLNRRGHQFSRLLAAEVCASAVVMLDTLCCEVLWKVLAAHSVRQFPFHFLSRASPCAVTFELDSTFLSACLKAFLVTKPMGTDRYVWEVVAACIPVICRIVARFVYDRS